jgi:hypothetical protein
MIGKGEEASSRRAIGAGASAEQPRRRIISSASSPADVDRDLRFRPKAR